MPERDLLADDQLERKLVADDLARVRTKFVNLILNDAAKEFSDVVATGFGQDGAAEDAKADFVAVRGQFETNKFVKQMKDDIRVRLGRKLMHSRFQFRSTDSPGPRRNGHSYSRSMDMIPSVVLSMRSRGHCFLLPLTVGQDVRIVVYKRVL